MNGAMRAAGPEGRLSERGAAQARSARPRAMAAADARTPGIKRTVSRPPVAARAYSADTVNLALHRPCNEARE